MAKPTVKELLAAKGRKKFTQVCVSDADTARACDLAGIDMLAVGATQLQAVRAAAPNCFITGSPPRPPCLASDPEAIGACYALMTEGADAVYMPPALGRIKAVAGMRIPVFSHVGFVPYHATWTGGARAVGKTAPEALQLYRDTLALQEAGVIGVEMELVPHRIAAEIARRVNMLVISMGSGPDCDGEYLFARDILGSHDGHYPRHAKKYRNHFEDSVQVFKEFSREVDSGAFPTKANIVEIRDEEFDRFMDEID